MVTNHLSRTPNAPLIQAPINEDFPDEHILAIFKEPWYADIVNYLATGQLPADWTKQDQCRFFAQVRYFFWEEPYLFKYCPDQIIRQCIPKEEQRSVLRFWHELACDGHFGPRKTAEKVLQCGFYWPTLFKDSFHFCKSCGELSEDWENFKKRHDAPEPDSWSWNFWCLGYRLHGTIPKFLRQPVHLGCYRLCL